MTPEREIQSRVDNERARRIAIQAMVSRRVDERTRMLDPALRNCSHAEHVRRLAVFLGEIGALDPAGSWDFQIAVEQCQEVLVELAAYSQAWMETIARDAEQ